MTNENNDSISHAGDLSADLRHVHNARFLQLVDRILLNGEGSADDLQRKVDSLRFAGASAVKITHEVFEPTPGNMQLGLPAILDEQGSAVNGVVVGCGTGGGAVVSKSYKAKADGHLLRRAKNGVENKKTPLEKFARLFVIIK
jgi:hypothetical protein